MENYIDQYRKNQVFLKKLCNLSGIKYYFNNSQKHKLMIIMIKQRKNKFKIRLSCLISQILYQIKVFLHLFKVIDFLKTIEKQSNAEEPVQIKTLDNYFSYKLLQNKVRKDSHKNQNMSNEKIKIYPFCEYTFVLLIEKYSNKETQDLQNYKFLIKCENCKQSTQQNNPSSSSNNKKNSLISLQPVQKIKSSTSLVRQLSNRSIEETSQESGNPSQSTYISNKQQTNQDQTRALSKSYSAVQFSSLSAKRSTIALSVSSSGSIGSDQPPKIRRVLTNQNKSETDVIKEFDEKEENEQQGQQQCDCQVLMNVGLNLNNSTPLIIRWTHENMFQRIFTISQYKIIWSHKGSDILLVKLHRRKDHLLQVNTFYNLKMTVQNLTNRPLDLNCRLPLKISTKQNVNDIDSKVVAICKESILELGLINPNEEIQTTFEYYLLSEGGFRFNNIIFFDQISQREIKVAINIFELVK